MLQQIGRDDVGDAFFRVGHAIKHAPRHGIGKRSGTARAGRLQPARVVRHEGCGILVDEPGGLLDPVNVGRR